ncbi:MAG: hypothetical protein JSS10_06615 [Verrucomicrobia bacterium]|nr:hypothetical protein [Verrucomicrobiota bacterium]
MSLTISSFYTPEAQNFVFRHSCFPILVDLVAYRCLKPYAYAPAYSTLAGLATCAAIAYRAPLPLQLLGGGIYLAYKATSFAISYFTSSKTGPNQSWDDTKILAALNMILPLIEESKSGFENLYTTSGTYRQIIALSRDPSKFRLGEIFNADVNTLAGVVKELLKNMNPPLLANIKDSLVAATSLEDEEKKRCLTLALQQVSPLRVEIFQKLIRHLHTITQQQPNSAAAALRLGQLFSQSFTGVFSANQLITSLIQNPKILQ